MKISRQMHNLHGTIMTTGKRMCAEAKKLYPVDSRWRIQITSVTTIEAAVVGHSESYWSTPGVVVVRNLKTGALRFFSPHFNAHEAL